MVPNVSLRRVVEDEVCAFFAVELNMSFDRDLAIRVSVERDRDEKTEIDGLPPDLPSYPHLYEKVGEREERERITHFLPIPAGRSASEIPIEVFRGRRSEVKILEA